MNRGEFDILLLNIFSLEVVSIESKATHIHHVPSLIIIYAMAEIYNGFCLPHIQIHFVLRNNNGNARDTPQSVAMI